MLIISNTDYDKRQKKDNNMESSNEKMGRRTLNHQGALYVEGLSMLIIPDNRMPAWAWLLCEDVVNNVKDVLGTDHVYMDDNDIACKLSGIIQALFNSGDHDRAYNVYLLESRILKFSNPSTRETLFEHLAKWKGR